MKIEILCPRCRGNFIIHVPRGRNDVVCPSCSMKFILDRREDGTLFITKYLFGIFQ